MFYVSISFVHVHSHHRDLHSFPTRRSSDLLLIYLLNERKNISLEGLVKHLNAEGREVAMSTAEQLWMEGREEDRKSTRLNSSHVSISYAVFCLKKKKATITDSTTSVRQLLR